MIVFFIKSFFNPKKSIRYLIFYMCFFVLVVLYFSFVFTDKYCISQGLATVVFTTVSEGKPCGIIKVRPPAILTAFDSIFTDAPVNPSRFAVTVIVPGVSVERIATRLMPHSVSR